jgi:RNA polymerase primary sigma factor
MPSLAEQNRGWACTVADRYAARVRFLAIPTDDLRAAAFMGLCEAEKRYDPSKGVRFISYATHWIKRELIDAIRNAPLVHPSAGREQRLRKRGTPLPMAQMVRESDAEENEPTVFDRLVAPIEDADAAIYAHELRAIILEVMAGLRPGERDVIEKRFGFNGGPGMTLKEIGETVGLSRERIRQIEALALAEIGRALRRRRAA